MAQVVFVRLARFPGAQECHFAALRAAMGDAPVPVGRLLFAAGPVDGGWQVVQVWQDRDQLDDFNARWFLPALASLGPAAFPEPPVVQDLDPVLVEWQDRRPPGNGS